MASSFIGRQRMRYQAQEDKSLEELRKEYGNKGTHAVLWRNRRPICPYGCGEEGTLIEIVVQKGKALGIYTHSGSIKPFTAELQMAPKPTGRKVVIGPDGEPKIVEEEST